MQMTSLFPVPTPTLIRWLRPLPPIHQILRSRQMSEAWPFLFLNPPSHFPTPQFAQSNTHTRVILNNSLLPLERTPCIPTHFKFMSMSDYSLPGFTPYSPVAGMYQLVSTKGNPTYHLYVPYPVPFHVCSSHLVPEHITIPYSETINYPKLCSPHSNRLR